ncbi:molybdenum ABC transporter ATP-binding protein [Gemmatimonas aurantiaca T-27]|uniref:Molybdenum ABC transporter ATP-binding protein n=2 Tax=Gemmatimonas aurantiaca TaxID=173480 RepID=C1ABQ1_GEMAT|nr:ATP-binding cassette domain-containing protein [Gemmatimonas aurantiaca]BAH39928.1 molybdenum ABC transporter ATP-binding protein [Gemmatimonas aurantiaca T-27]
MSIDTNTATNTGMEGAREASNPVLDVTIRRRLPTFELDIAFRIHNGIAALVGPSGSGKTLTLRAIAGLLHVTGRIVLNTRVLLDINGARARIDLPARDRHIGYVFQHYALFPHYTAAQNIAYGLQHLPRRVRDARVQDMLALVRLEQHAQKRPASLSGGEQQRIALARALAPSPSLLLLDEPLSALDAPLRRTLGAELRTLHRETGVPMLLVTHDPDEAARIADVTVEIDAGKVITTRETGTPP